MHHLFSISVTRTSLKGLPGIGDPNQLATKLHSAASFVRFSSLSGNVPRHLREAERSLAARRCPQCAIPPAEGSLSRRVPRERHSRAAGLRKASSGGREPGGRRLQLTHTHQEQNEGPPPGTPSPPRWATQDPLSADCSLLC